MAFELYTQYLQEIEDRKEEGLNPKPIDAEDLLSEIISQIKEGNENKEQCLKFFIYNTLPGTTSAASVKAKFLKEIILGEYSLNEISVEFAYQLLSHMKGGPSIEVLLDLALGNDITASFEASKVLKTQVFLYEADVNRLEDAYKNGSEVAKDILQSYANQYRWQQ